MQSPGLPFAWYDRMPTFIRKGGVLLFSVAKYGVVG